MVRQLVKPVGGHNANENLFHCCDECNDKFVTNHRLIEHLIRDHNQSLDVLPIPLMENILDFVHPNDLIAVSQTCHKLKDGVESFFERKRQCGLIRIHKVFKEPYIMHRFHKKYEIYFRSLIRNISVDFWDKLDANVFRFIKEHCSKDLQRLHFYNNR